MTASLPDVLLRARDHARTRALQQRINPASIPAVLARRPR